MATLHFQVDPINTWKVSLPAHQSVSVRIRSGATVLAEPPPAFLDIYDADTGCRIGTIRMFSDEAEKVRLDLTDIRNKRESNVWINWIDEPPE